MLHIGQHLVLATRAPAGRSRCPQKYHDSVPTAQGRNPRFDLPIVAVGPVAELSWWVCGWVGASVMSRIK